TPRRMPAARPGVRPRSSESSVASLRSLPGVIFGRSAHFPFPGGSVMRTRTTLTAAAVLAAGVLLGWLAASGLPVNVFAQDKPAEKSPTGGSPILPVPDAPFGGVIGRKANESRPAFPTGVTAPKGAPNVLLVMTDDTGFGATSTFGGPIPTP